MSSSKRRGQGEGSIYQRSDGRWCAVLDLGYVQGKRRRKVAYGKTRKEAGEKLRTLQQQQQAGVNLAAERQTVEQYLTYWHQHHVTGSHADSTIIDYRNAITLHIVPSIGHVRLDKLSPQHIHAMITDMRDSSAPGSVAYYFRVLHAALDRAVKLGLIARNPADAVDRPQPGDSPARAVTRDDEQLIFKLLKQEQHRLQYLFLLAIKTGLRKGELLALLWADIDFEQATLTVKAGKTKASRRTLSLPTMLISALRSHWSFQATERLACERWQEQGLVFPNSSGKPLYASGLDVAWKAVQQRAGIESPYRFHDLRHTCATRLAEAGEHPRVAMEILGHASIRTTMEIYTHVSSQSQREALERLSKTGD
jgi:integrase